MNETTNKLCFHTTSSRISASAGTGKTYQLASRYIALLMLGADPESIIALTFTKKAAGEFRSRILHALAEGACDVKNDAGRNVMTARVWDAWSGCAQDEYKNIIPAANDIPLLPATSPVVRRAAAENMYPEELYAQDRELQAYLQLPNADAKKFRELLHKTVKVLSKLELSTIDSFFNTLVTGSCLELGVDAVSPLDPADEPMVRHRNVGDYLEARTTNEGKRAEFLRMFARLTKGKGSKTIPKLENYIEAFLHLYQAHPSVDVWGNVDFFKERCSGFSILTDQEAENWPKEAERLKQLLHGLANEDFPLHVYSGLMQLVAGETPPTSALTKWVGSTISYLQMNDIHRRAKAVMAAFDGQDSNAGNLDEALTLVQKSDWSKALKDAFENMVNKLKKGKFTSTKAIDDLRTMLDGIQERADEHWKKMNLIWKTAQRLCNQLPAKLLHDAQTRTRCMYSLLRDYADTHEQRIMTTGEFSFADIARKAQGLMNQLVREENPGDPYYCRDHLALRMGRKYQHWMLDEFQDTSDDQFATLEPVLECLALDAGQGRTDFTQESPRRLPASLRPYHKDATHCVGAGSIFVVGDEKQGIYGFRTGETQAFTKLRQEEPWHPPIENASLRRSFRSAPAIMGENGFVNLLFSALKRQEETDAPDTPVDLSDYTKHETTLAKKGYVELRVVGSESTDEDQPDNAYVEIGKILKSLTEGNAAPIHGISIAILTRSNREAEEVMDYLRDAMPELPVLLVKDTLSAVSCPLGEMLHHFFRWLLHPQENFSAAIVRASFMGSLISTDETEAQTWSRWREYVDKNGYAVMVKNLGNALPENLQQENRETLNIWLTAARNFDANGGTLANWEHHIATIGSQGVGSSRYVQIMTMHKSKGLEFDAVILPFMAKDAIDGEGDLDFFLAPDDSSLLLCPTKVSDSLKCWPGAFDECTTKWKFQKSREAYNLLYVAVTRAKYANYILLNGASLEKKDTGRRRSIAGLIRRALGESLAAYPHTEKLAQTWGDENWYKDLKDKTANGENNGQNLPELGVSVARRPRISPSKLAEEDTPETTDEPKAKVWHGDGSAAERGTRVHALFEQVEWWEPGQPLPFQEDESEEAEMVRAALNVPEIAAIFHKVPGTLAYNEQHIESIWNHRKEKVWVSGTIDRLILTEKDGKTVAAHIYDYKTNDRQGSTPQAQDNTLREQYRQQMTAYRDLVCAAFELPQESVSATLVSCPRKGEPRLVKAL